MEPSRYSRLGLTNNPFPQTPTVDPTSTDIRMNGSIYNEEIFFDQIAGLRQRLERRENLIYAQNTKFVVGVGKSALIAREWRRLQGQSPEPIYVRCGRAALADSVAGACNAIVNGWLKNGALWSAFCGILKDYATPEGRPDLDRGTVDTLISVHTTMPTTLSPRTLMLWDTKTTVENVATWLEDRSTRVQREIAEDFLHAMLSTPRKFGESYPKRAKRKEAAAFSTILELLRIGNVGYLYVFLDQFEELFHGRGQRQLHDLASGMRQILEASTNLATFVVTLHPSAAMQLRSSDAQSLTTIAPVDDRRVVDLPNITGTQAVRLAKTYLDRFRLAEADQLGEISPFEQHCIVSIAADQDGNCRGILQVLHYCIESAVEHGVNLIDEGFFQEHYREITGRVSERDLEL